MQNTTVTSHLLAIMTAERNKRKSGKFFVAGGPVLASYKMPRKALCNLYFGKMKAEEYIVSDFFGYTGPTAKRRMRPHYVPSISNKLAIDGF